MKVGSVLLALALVLAVLGAGLSYSGYNGSQPMTATSTVTVASTSSELVLMTTSSMNWILQDEVIKIPAGQTQVYCGYMASRNATLETGQIHVSYSTDSIYHHVDFWMMNKDDYTRWWNMRYCSDLLSYSSNSKPFVVKLGRSGYEFTTEIGSAGRYFFGFLNENSYPINVTLNVDSGMQTSEVTITKATTYFSTQESPYVTSSVVPAGFGLLFYAGIGLIAVAVIVLAISRMKTAAPRTAPPSTSPVVAQAGPVVSSPPAPATGKLCISCGAPLPSHAPYCSECGSKQ